MAQKKRLQDLKRGNKDFPECREYIEKEGLVPHVLRDVNAAYWDGLSAIDRNGRIIGGLSESQRKEMVNMILDGRYGQEIKEAFIDEASYWKIRDALITWPNRERIEKDCLATVKISHTV